MSDIKILVADIRRAVQDGDITLTEWEEEFLQAIRDYRNLSDKQDAVLERIWRKATGRS